MDITAAIAPLLTQLWFLLPLLLIATLLKTAWFKGMVGEWFINLCIRLFLDKREYRLLKDVTLPTPQGSTQIDHVIVSRFGLFVIETKNMKGWIFGDPRHKRWTQQLFRRRHGFQNPLHQNYLHLMTLKSLLGLADHQLHSIVYFIGDCTFKTPMPENVMRRGLVSYIKSKTTPVLSTADVDRIIDTIQQGRLTASWQTHRQHVTQLKTRHADPSANHVSTREPVRQSVANPPSQSVSPPDNPPPICPRCGSTMVLRTATRGENKGNQFWGCSGFPKCRQVAHFR
ncbi:NERD domain-containing protein [Aeromonas caviae]|uniref:nuclease-related domain-containing protein n=1 Tax=Aeromonas caviae TaxID=648 RepID=UPI0038CF4528